MSEMLVDIKRVVDSVSNRTSQWDVLYEAIINSIHANASHIECRLTGNQDVIETEDGEVAPRKVEKIEIEDNGDGFDDKNYKSFGKYGTDHKIDLGCKGIGRFVFLKVFDTVRYTSLLSESKKKIEFAFDTDFESDNIREEAIEVSENKTTLTLSGVMGNILNREKQVDRRLDLDLEEIREKVFLHLVPTLFFHKEKGRHIQIEFVDTSSEETSEITEKDIPDFSTTPFAVRTADEKEIAFSVHYSISNASGGVNAFHCANRRAVCTFSDQGFKPEGFQGWLLLESDYFSDRVNDARNNFDIFPVRVDDLFSTLSWDMINQSLKAVVAELVQKKIPQVKNTNRKRLQEIQEERPYLAQYIDEEDLSIAGFISKKQIIKKAKKRFDEAKEHLLANAGKAEYSDNDLEEAIQIAQSELVAYVHDRVLIVRQLKKMLDDKEQSEEMIHNLFMKRFTEDSEYDYFSSKRNNLWLLDDRFTSYSYAASEKRILQILEQEGTGNDLDRPDLALFFSQNPATKRD
jgi:hypothetical protein